MQQFITKSLHIERITLVGPASESKGVLVWLNEKGYWIVKCGPYHDADMFPRVDINRFLIIAERWIEGTIPVATVAAALRELRAEMLNYAPVAAIDAAIAALGLTDETPEGKCT
jgi:hypothetical protein